MFVFLLVVRLLSGSMHVTSPGCCELIRVAAVCVLFVIVVLLTHIDFSSAEL